MNMFASRLSRDDLRKSRDSEKVLVKTEIQSAAPKWRLYLDDARARSFDEARNLTLERGCPEHVCFDFHLGEVNLTGKDFADWLILADQRRVITIPEEFEFDVHSSDAVGAAAIHNALARYLKYRP